MAINIYDELASNDMYRDAFMNPRKPGIPNEVRLWPDYLQELFCILSDQHLDAGIDLDEADRVAIEQVKESERYREWQQVVDIRFVQKPLGQAYHDEQGYSLPLSY